MRKLWGRLVTVRHDVFQLFGLGVVSAGVWQWSSAAALVVAGAGVVGLSTVAERG